MNFLKKAFGKPATKAPAEMPEELARQLLEAVDTNDEAWVLDLARRGAPVDARDNIQRTALMVAAEEGYDKIVAVLLAHKADASLVNGLDQTALHFALRRAQKDIALSLIPLTPINGQDNHGATPAFYAARTGTAEALEALAQKQADFTIADVHGKTPLMEAIGCGHPEAVDVLVKYDCALNARDEDGRTALMHATILRNLPLVEKFLSLGAHAQLKDKAGDTAAALARRLGIEGQVLEKLEAAENAPAEAFRSGAEKNFSAMKKITFARPGATA